MTLNEFQQQVLKTKKAGGLTYTGLALAGEAGEVVNEIKKVLRDRDGELTNETKRKIVEELGDTLWYIASMAHDLDVTMEQVAGYNLEKLSFRYMNDVVLG